MMYHSFFYDDLKLFRVLNHILTKDEFGRLRKAQYNSFHETLKLDKETSVKLSHAGEPLICIAEMMYPDRFKIKSEDTSPIGKNSYQYIQWVGIVKYRDGNACKKCKSTKNLQAHHIKPVSKYPDLIIDIDNGITLCESCHKEFHSRYGDADGIVLKDFLKE
jgi:hypothetical protein